METTFFLIKPDGVKRRLCKTIFKLIETNLRIVSITLEEKPCIEKCKFHYIDQKNQDYYEELCTFISTGPIVLIIAKGDKAVSVGRATLDYIRSVYVDPQEMMENVIHASDSTENAQREMAVWYGKEV